jgi:hypothetical protein
MRKVKSETRSLSPREYSLRRYSLLALSKSRQQASEEWLQLLRKNLRYPKAQVL